MERFSRTELLVGPDKLARLAGTAVVVLGLGGVGSWAAEALVRAGIGHIRLVDHDVVASSNINRQLAALDSTVGKPKAQVLAERFWDINPHLKAEAVVEFYRPGEGTRLLEGCDWVVDAVDTVTAKLDIICTCLERGQPLISSMGAGNKLDAQQLRISDISATVICPLARIMRKELHKRGIWQGVPVVWSPEKPVPPRQTLTHASRRQLPGSISFVPATAGMLIASYIVNRVLRTN